VPRKITKQTALDRLTFGVPTLSIDYFGRRQVFVESNSDAAILEYILSIMKSKLKLPKALNFISAAYITPGDKTKETHGGADIVINIVSQLAQSGNASIYGLVDWDGKREHLPQIHVLGHGNFYAIENILIDPLLVGALLLREGTPIRDTHMPFTSLGKARPEDLQRLADMIALPVLNKLNKPEAAKNMVKKKYYGGFSLDIDQTLCLTRGHDVVDVFLDEHKRLKKYTSRGSIAKAIVELVLLDYPEFCPSEIVETLWTIASDATVLDC
jgi:hypothetical protein